MASARRRGAIVEINVTPLVDIMLVLLIIFMLTAHMIAKQAIAVELPPAANSNAAPPTTIAITLTKEGRLFLNGETVTPSQLHDAVQAAVAKDPKTNVLISGDKDMHHGRLVWVLDLLNSLRVPSFSIEIDHRLAIAPEPT